MRLKKISYSEHVGEAQEWRLVNLELGQVNLIVGKNASGKTRALNVIGGMGRLLTNPTVVLRNCSYSAEFEENGSCVVYELEIKNEWVQSERLEINGRVVLNRGADGVGEIDYAEIGAKHKFQLPPFMLAAMTRRDSIQHPFLEPLYAWASELRHYRFGADAAKQALAVFMEGGPQLDEKDQVKVSGLFRHAVKKFGDEFVQALKADLLRVGYSVEDVFLKPPLSVKIEGDTEFVALCVKESDLLGYTDQFAMSDGMFRALTILIFVNYYAFSNLAGALLIDDIGEGLDFDRSCKIINLLREKALGTRMQLVLSTNDRFVMNAVPLQEWSVLQRHGSTVSVKNYNNSKSVFDEFAFTGLSNFSFLELDVLSENNFDQEGA
jgi:energy-coupling factor transporter ATP-binding protein EcfA2